MHDKLSRKILMHDKMNTACKKHRGTECVDHSHPAGIQSSKVMLHMTCTKMCSVMVTAVVVVLPMALPFSFGIDVLAFALCFVITSTCISPLVHKSDHLNCKHLQGRRDVWIFYEVPFI